MILIVRKCHKLLSAEQITILYMYWLSHHIVQPGMKCVKEYIIAEPKATVAIQVFMNVTTS